MVDVSVSNKSRLTVWQCTDYSVTRLDLTKEEHERLTHHIVSVSVYALADGLVLIYSRGGDIKAE